MILSVLKMCMGEVDVFLSRYSLGANSEAGRVDR